MNIIRFTEVESILKHLGMPAGTVPYDLHRCGPPLHMQLEATIPEPKLQHVAYSHLDLLCEFLTSLEEAELVEPQLHLHPVLTCNILTYRIRGRGSFKYVIYISVL
jgi:hypothetical protein